MAGDANFVRSRLFAAIGRVGQRGGPWWVPAVLILDDMQWVDADTVDMVHYLARSWAESGAPILLLLAVRQESYAADAAVRPGMAGARRPRCASRTRSLLEPLNGTTVQQIVNCLAYPEADEEQTHAFGDWLWAETQGLPFFIQALLQMLIAKGTLAFTEKEGHSGYDFAVALNQVKSRGQIQVPPGVRDAILSRLDRLSEKEADILLAAAVLGRECSLERRFKVAGVTELDALAGVEALLNSRLLTENRTAGSLTRWLTTTSAKWSTARATKRADGFFTAGRCWPWRRTGLRRLNAPSTRWPPAGRTGLSLLGGRRR